PGVPLVGWIGRFVAQKHPRAMLDVVARVLERRPDAHIVLAGDGPLRAALVRAFADDARVHLPGELSNVPGLLASLDVYVTTSRWEGLPLGVLKAMAAGRPVVASAIPAHATLLSQAGAGVLVGEDAHDRMGDAIADLLDQPALRAEMGARA